MRHTPKRKFMLIILIQHYKHESISRKSPPPLCLLFQLRTRPPPIGLSLRIHLLQESLHPLFRLVYRQSTSTSLPIGFSVRNETFPSAQRADTGFIPNERWVEIVSKMRYNGGRTLLTDDLVWPRTAEFACV
jgi:hypothetical protein